MALVTLQHTNINSGNKVAIPCSGVSVGYTKTNSNNPNANYDGEEPVVRVQNKSLGNPLYTLTNIKLDPNTTTIKTFTVLTQELLKQFLTVANDDSDPILLNVVYGDSTNWTSLNKYSGSRVSDIPVTIQGGITVSLNTREVRDAYMPTISGITLVETKKV